MAYTWVFIIVASLVVGVQQAFADGPCSGYEGILEKLRVCEGTESSIITVDNLNATLHEDCTVTGLGSGTFKSFATAILTYDFKIRPTPSPFRSVIRLMPLKGEFDACQIVKLAPKEVMDMLKGMDLPNGCPVEEKTITITESTTLNLLEIPNYKILLELMAAVGHTTGKISVVHDTGVTCLEFAGVMAKK